jgi:hypothetical protein
MDRSGETSSPTETRFAVCAGSGLPHRRRGLLQPSRCSLHHLIPGSDSSGINLTTSMKDDETDHLFLFNDSEVRHSDETGVCLFD